MSVLQLFTRAYFFFMNITIGPKLRVKPYTYSYSLSYWLVLHSYSHTNT